ncbi:MAG: protease HtpX [Gammaproteobacteria bacterium]
MKRVLLFVGTNLAILVVLGITATLLGVTGFLGGNSLNVPALLGFAAVFGMGGAFLSLAISKWVARKSTGARVIEQPADEAERWLLETVAFQARRAGVKMPQVAIYDSPDANAFATGPSRNNALVAVSTGLLASMNRDEVEAVLAHEVSHVANGDMVTLALIQGVLNTFVIALARVAGFLVDRAVSANNDDDHGAHGPGIAYWVTTIAAEILLGILATLVVMWFSRKREFRADAGGAALAGRGKMVAALERLRSLHEPAQMPSQMAAFGINSGRGGVMHLFMSHPPLEQRIAALKGETRAPVSAHAF